MSYAQMRLHEITKNTRSGGATESRLHSMPIGQVHHGERGSDTKPFANFGERLELG